MRHPTAASQGGDVLAGTADDPSAEGQDQAALLGAADEDRRRHIAQLRVRPTRQCLDRDDPSGRHVHDRLVGDGESFVLDGHGAAGTRDPGEPRPRPAWTARRGHRSLGRSTLARYIATSASRSRSSAVWWPREARTTPMLLRMEISRSSRRNGASNDLEIRSARSSASWAAVTSSTRMANSSPPSRAIVSSGRRHRMETSGDRHEQPVADRVTKAVVDRLEPIEVEEQQADKPSAGRAPRQGVLDPVLEQCAVGEAGQVVMERLHDEPFLELAANGDVRQGAGESMASPSSRHGWVGRGPRPRWPLPPG